MFCIGYYYFNDKMRKKKRDEEKRKEEKKEERFGSVASLCTSWCAFYLIYICRVCAFYYFEFLILDTVCACFLV